MLDVLGDGFVAQHVAQSVEMEAREHQYRAYVTDALYVIAGGPAALSHRWAEADPGFQEPGSPQAADDIKAHILGELTGGAEDESI